MIFVAMEIMNAFTSRFLTVCSLIAVFSFSANAADLTLLHRVIPKDVEQTAGDRAAAMALLSQNLNMGYTLSAGTKTVVITLSKIESVDSISFLNQGAKGEVTIATSNAKLPENSDKWQLVAKHDLTGNAVNAKVGPGEAKYIKLTFSISEAGRLANLGVYSTASLSYGAVMQSDGKEMVDGKDAKDLGEGKDIPAEAPAEGPGPTLPDPPPFVFVPVTVPTSP